MPFSLKFAMLPNAKMVPKECRFNQSETACGTDQQHRCFKSQCILQHYCASTNKFLMTTTDMSFQAPSTAKRLRTDGTLVVAYASMLCHVASKVSGGEAAHTPDLVPIGVVASVHGLMMAQPLGRRKRPITL